MSFINKNPNLIKEIVNISKDAGKIILDIYKDPENKFLLKKDSSPLTLADTESNKFIAKELANITPELPILSEEGKSISFNDRSKWEEYWLIDPLDGTKEFLKKNDEFTVNIALIKNNRPVFGVIDIPAKKETYWGAQEMGSHLITNNKTERISILPRDEKKIRILTSRSHSGNEDLILKRLENYELISAGSSLKFCLIANGRADAYVRFGPTSEWDTAAGEAIVRFAGGIVVDFKNDNLIYNKGQDLINPHFLVTANRRLANILLKLINSER